METHKKKTLDLREGSVKYDNDGNIIFGTGYLKEPVVCLRPGHKSGLPQIYAEEKNGKIISHNYAHSGVGYAILFGSVEKAIENFQKLRFELGEKGRSIFYDQEITIIGLGCVGLVTALTLYFRGFKNIRLVGEKFLKTPSFGAGGLIDFSLSTIFTQEQIASMNELFRYSFSEYQQIYQGKHKFIKYGIKEVDYYTDFYQEGAGLSYLANLGIIPKGKEVELSLEGLADSNNKFTNEDKELAGPKRKLFHFKTFNVNTYQFMSSLLYTIERLRIPVEYKKINSFNEIKSKVLFNCTGMGSRELNNDKNCYPICGHGFVLSDEALGSHGYILRLSTIPELANDPINGALYFMPKASGFVGGTYMKDYDGSDDKLNDDLLIKLLERTKFVFNGIRKIKPKF